MLETYNFNIYHSCIRLLCWGWLQCTTSRLYLPANRKRKFVIRLGFVGGSDSGKQIPEA